MLQGQGKQSGTQHTASLVYPLQKAWRANRLHYRATNGGHECIAVIGPPLVARFKAADCLCRDQSRERNTAANPLAQGHDVRTNSRMFKSIKSPGAANPCLHLVQDKQHPLALREFAQCLQKILSRRQNTRLTLCGLKHDRGHIIGQQCLDRSKVIQVGFRETRHLGLE